MLKKDMHLEVLDAKRKKLLDRLGFITEHKFYLAGGTALALQIGHRASADFDFYTATPFDSVTFWARFHREIPDSENTRIADGTLMATVDKNVEFSFFFYDYPLLEPLVSCQPLSLASLKDIAAMKVVAIEQRGIRRDFVDLYFLAKKMQLFEIISATVKKYPGHDVYPALQALNYFEDADREPDRPLNLIKAVTWQEIKNFFLKEARDVQKFF